MSKKLVVRQTRSIDFAYPIDHRFAANTLFGLAAQTVLRGDVLKVVIVQLDGNEATIQMEEL